MKVFILLLLFITVFVQCDVLKRGHKCSSFFLDNVGTNEAKIEICNDGSYFIPGDSTDSGYGSCLDVDTCSTSSYLINTLSKQLVSNFKDELVTEDKNKTFCNLNGLLSEVKESCKSIFELPKNRLEPRGYNCTYFLYNYYDQYAKCPKENGLFSSGNVDCRFSIKDCCKAVNFGNYFKTDPKMANLQTLLDIYNSSSKYFNMPIQCENLLIKPASSAAAPAVDDKNIARAAHLFSRNVVDEKHHVILNPRQAIYDIESDSHSYGKDQYELAKALKSTIL